MITAQKVLTLILQSAAAVANILLVAKSIDLPMKTSEELIKSSPFVSFFFLFAFAISVTTSYVPALIGAAVYFILENDSIMRMMYENNGGKKATRQLRPNPFSAAAN